MSSAYARSASEPRERRSYPRERQGTSFWNPNAPRNVDADSWRRDPDRPPSRGAPPTRGPREERDRSRGRMERPPSRGSGGEYRHPREFHNGARYPGSYRGRGGRGRREGGPMGESNGRSPYRGYPRYPPMIPLLTSLDSRYGGPSSGQGTQFFSPLTSPPPDPTKFNAPEALTLFSQRWQVVSNDLNDKSLPHDQKPTVYKADTASTSVWDQSKVHIQAGITDFLSELRAAIERDQKSQTEDEVMPSES